MFNNELMIYMNNLDANLIELLNIIYYDRKGR
jgi:hypothetical protein